MYCRNWGDYVLNSFSASYLRSLRVNVGQKNFLEALKSDTLSGLQLSRMLCTSVATT